MTNEQTTLGSLNILNLLNSLNLLVFDFARFNSAKFSQEFAKAKRAQGELLSLVSRCIIFFICKAKIHKFRAFFLKFHSKIHTNNTFYPNFHSKIYIFKFLWIFAKGESALCADTLADDTPLAMTITFINFSQISPSAN